MPIGASVVGWGLSRQAGLPPAALISGGAYRSGVSVAFREFRVH